MTLRLRSSGRSGAERATLDFAELNAIPCAGLVSGGDLEAARVAGLNLPERYPFLAVDPLATDREVLTRNVEDSDAVLAFRFGSMGSEHLEVLPEICGIAGKPLFLYGGLDPRPVHRFLNELPEDLTLLVTGQRSQEATLAYEHTMDVLDKLLLAF